MDLLLHNYDEKFNLLSKYKLLFNLPSTTLHDIEAYKWTNGVA